VGKPGLDLAVESEKQSAQENTEKLREGIKEHYEIWMCRKDGDKVCLLASGSPILNPQGQHTANLGMYVDITERKKAEEELKKSEARLRLIAKAGRIGFFEYNASKDVAYWSPEHYELLGYESGSVISWQRWLQGINPEDKERIIANATQLMKRARSEGHVEGYKDEYRFIRPDGSIIWIESDLSLTMINNEAIFRGSIRDITKRKKAEEALKQSQELIVKQLEEITYYYDNAPIGLAILDTNLRYIKVNKWLAEINGVPTEEHAGKTIREIVPALGEQIEDLKRKIVASGEAVRNIEFSGESAACPGERRTLIESWIPIKDSLGEVTALYVIAEDITERKKAEEALKQNEQTFLELIERAPFGIYVVNSQFRIAHMNKGSQDGAFRNVRPVLGRDFSEAMQILWSEPTASEILSHFRHTLETDEPYFSPKFIHSRHDIEIVEAYEWELQHIRLPDGQYGVICYYFDSTKLRETERGLKEAQAQLKEYATNLERIVEERTKQLKDSERLATIGATAGMVGMTFAIHCKLLRAICT
jgi:PAS domain S-box-containing protein